MRSPLVVTLAIASAAATASADREQLSASLRVGAGETVYATTDDAPSGYTPVIELEGGSRLLPELAVVGFASLSWFSDDVILPFSEGRYRTRERNLGLGVRVYGYLGRVFGFLAVGRLVVHSVSDGFESDLMDDWLLQAGVGVDVVRTGPYSFHVAALTSVGLFRDFDLEITQRALCIGVRWH